MLKSILMSFTAFFSGIVPHRAITPFFSRTPKRDSPRQLAHQNPNPVPLDKVSMTTTTPPAHYRNPALIPADELAEAEASFRAVSETEHEYEWRMRNYKFYRIGWGWQVRCYYPHFVKSHEEALRRMTDACDHKFVSVPHTTSECHILGTYDRGLMNTCTKCGHKEYKRTSYNNYSGD